MNGMAKILPGGASAEDWLRRFDTVPRDELEGEAARLRDAAHGDLITYSRKVFIPLT